MFATLHDKTIFLLTVKEFVNTNLNIPKNGNNI